MQRRWIVGISAGGYSAIRCALESPSTFSRCGAFSPGGLWIDVYLEYLRSQPRESMENRHLLEVFGNDLQCQPNDILLNLIAKVSSQAMRPELFITMGVEDGLKPPCDAFVDRLVEMGYPHIYQVLAGGHNWTFWRQSLESFLNASLPPVDSQ